MLTDERIAWWTSAAALMEREVRQHLAATKNSASEQARGLVAYRHATAARKAFEAWQDTRVFRRAQRRQTA